MRSPTSSPRSARRLAWGLSGAATGVWAVVVVSTGSVGRVLDHWESAATMLFGSFLAGSSPEGGGAVAFPVFTKVLHVDAPVARSFGLAIQAVGMSMAAVSILLYRRAIHARGAVIATLAAVAGFLVSTVLFGRSGEPFWPPNVGTAWVKATFSIILATTSILMVRHLREDAAPGAHEHTGLPWNGRVAVSLAAVGAIGGVLASWTGTGANIAVFLFLVVLIDVNPKVALPTAIIVMAAVSVVGLAVHGIADGQLAIDVAGDRVTSVGGVAVDLPAAEADLLGLWLAAVPVVVWGAPIGSLVASLVPESWLVRFVAVLAAVEVATTFLLVEELRSDGALIIYLVAGVALLPIAFVAGARRRERLFGG